jgi:spermidine dehydrogenase
MDRPITRRDFLNGVSVAIGASLIKPAGAAGALLDDQGPQAGPADPNYPPLRTGLRGSHPGSYEVAHAMRDGKTYDTGEETGESYDLVVVGGGMSGLGAAYYFRKRTVPGAKILILDNHDDFGGHARRNEFNVDGRLLMARGGTSYIERPATFTVEGRELLTDIGVDYKEPTYKIEQGYYASLGLRSAQYFDRETFGVDKFVVNPAAGGGFGGGGRPPSPEFLAKTPLSGHVQKELLRLHNDRVDYLPGLTPAEKLQKLKKMSYKDYLLNVVELDPDVLKYYHPGGNACPSLTIDTASAWFFLNHNGAGFQGLGVDLEPDAGSELDENPPIPGLPEQFHFPDGVHGVARLLVRSLIPEALPTRSMADGQLTRVQYERLDSPSNSVRIRLSSTVVRVRNLGDPKSAGEVEVIYIRNGKPYRIRAKGAVLACNHAVIPYLCPELPKAQKDALHLAVRATQMITNVALRDWKAFEKLGVSSVSCPGADYPGYASVGLNTPVTMGGYVPPRTPVEPIVATLGGGMGGMERKSGMTARDMFRAAREMMYQTPFETYERNIRTHLARVLGGGGFDPARDIAAITINRWPHGYATGVNYLFDPDWSDDELPMVKARKPFGRIAIANTDAVGICLTQAAFDQAHRAVSELDKRPMAYWNRA